ncbi:hypothetical protein [Phytopseudomonas daroniae]|uniref:hypothetical protein n=1 Tax=Phytopseudomonas daroniae TaxID=2487519 RepID=UPI001FC8F9D7|nr:hypothetical protein [Pseudomonas daroniae]
MMRYLLPILFAFLLSACGSDEQGGDVPRKNSEPAVVTREPANPVEPPAKAPTPVEESAPKSQPPVPRKAAPDKAVERAKAEKKPQKVVQAPPKTKLDLSLPPELAAKLEAEDQAAKDGLAPILPSFFEEKKPSLNPFQLSGKLITGETGDDYWDSIEGAELQFEFRR